MAKQHSDELKAQVIAALLAGQGVCEVAREYRLSKGLVSEWKRRSLGGSEQFGTQKRRELGELVGVYLETLLKTVTTQLEVFSNETWLRQQSASDAAVLHGVLVDKGLRLLEAAERAADQQDPPLA